MGHNSFTEMEMIILNKFLLWGVPKFVIWKQTELCQNIIFEFDCYDKSLIDGKSELSCVMP